MCDSRSRQLDAGSGRDFGAGLRLSLNLNLLDSLDHLAGTDHKHEGDGHDESNHQSHFVVGIHPRQNRHYD